MRVLERKSKQLAVDRKERAGRRRAISLMAALVVAVTAVALMVPAVSMTRGELVCGLEEHQHTDACYEQVLVCGYDDETAAEEAGHVHSDACYELRLICEIPEHVHSSACYDEPEPEGDSDVQAGSDTPSGTDDQSGVEDGSGDSGLEGAVEQGSESDDNSGESTDEPAEDQVDQGKADSDLVDDGSPTLDAGQSADDLADDSAAKDESGADKPETPMPAQSLEAQVDAKDGSTVKVSVEADEGALPKGATMEAKLVTDEDVIDAAKAEAAEQLEAEAEQTRALAVDITFFDADSNSIEPAKDVRVSFEAQEIAEQDQLAIVHVDDEANAELVDPDGVQAEGGEVSFDASEFSVYAVVYTVDFHWEVDGKTYDFSIPGGGFVSLEHLVEVLGIADGDTEIKESELETEAKTADVMLNVTASEAAKEFVADVESVEFSTPELLWTGKASTETTVGELKEANGLACEYSAELTDEQIDEINRTEVESGDWALISTHPFVSEEELTVTMNDGEAFTIRVTDAQISKDFITAEGETYTITVNYDEDAQIPNDADLKVSEIEEGTDEYQRYLNDAAEELGLENADEVSFARFFDIEIVDGDDNKIEPKTPVEVKIAYKDSLNVGLGCNVQIVHFAEQGTEVISDIALTKGNKVITYNQDSFSVTGTIVTSPTAGTENNPKQYALVVKYDGNFYSVNSDGSLAPTVVNDVNNPTSVVIGSPMLWTYASNGNIYHHTDAVDTGFGEVAADFYYKYVDVNSDDGIYNEEQITNFTKGQDAIHHYEGYTEPSKENDDVKLVVRRSYHPVGSQLAWTVQTHKQADRCRTNYNTSTHLLTNSDNSRVLDVVEVDGVLHLASEPAGSNNGVEVYFTDVHTSVPEVSPYDHTVNHIDISIDSSSLVEVPLAYGTYYDADHNPILRIDRNGNYFEMKNGAWVTATDSNGNPINKDNQLKVDHPITIDGEDIKAGTITATDQNGAVVENAFYVSGYSANAPSGDNNWQVRIEGSFKVATTNPVNKNSSTPNSQSVMSDRLQHKVYYTVSTVKYNEPVDVKYGSNKIQLYDNHGNALRFSVNIKVESDKFSYWDSRNDCPALALSEYKWQETQWNYGYPQNVTRRWSDGGIYTGNDPHDANWYMSGIDTDISGDKVTAKADVLAMEVTKYILDENGNVLSLQPGQNLQTKYEVFEKAPEYDPDDVKGLNPGDAIRGTHLLPQTSYEEPEDTLYADYAKTADLTIAIEDNGKGEVHNYDVTDGLYYIKEDPSSIKNTVIASDGTVYSYVETIIESEYAWRNDQYQRPTYGEAVHVSPTYTDKDNDTYRSIPEAIGEYKDKDGNWDQEDGTLLRNSFLPFYVYNVYKPVVADISVEKVWDDQGMTVDHSNTVISVTVKATIPTSDGTGTEDYTVEGVTGTYELRDGAWSKSFEDAPGMTADGREITYSVVENTVLDDYSSQVTTNQTTVDGKTVIQFTVTNTLSRGALKITKNVTYNKGEIGAIPTGKEPLVDKEFLFAVTKDGTPIDGSPFSITITNGASNSLTIPDLEIGNYVITEIDSKGLELTDYSGGISQDETTKSVTVTVTAGDTEAAQSTAQASFTNNYSETDIIVKKVDQDKVSANPEDAERFIAGAKFSLLDSDEHAVTGYKVISLKNNQEIELEDGKFVIPLEGVKITGLANGSYVLKEWEAPDGYIVTNDTTAFTVADGEVTAGSDGLTFEIPNSPGTALPNTGGLGTGPIYLLGVMLIALGGAGLVMRRKRKVA